MKASISLDGKLLSASGKPSRRAIPFRRIEEADELELTVHPLIVGGSTVPTLSGVPGVFLPEDVVYELRSVESRKECLVLNYRRKARAKVSRTT